MDCTFDCPGPSRKRAAARKYGRFRRIAQYASKPSSILHGVPSKVDEHLHNVRALSDHGPAWQKYAPSGARYYAEWQAKTGPDAEYPCNFEEEFSIEPIQKVRPVTLIRDTLQSEGYGIDREYYSISMSGPKSNPIADFTNTISASQGVFLANANSRGALPTSDDLPTGRPPITQQFSTVAWFMWQKTVLTEHPEWVVDLRSADFSGIKSFWRREIKNKDTVSILDEVFEGKDVNKKQTWTPDDTDQDKNPFWALLGSPNGVGITYFLKDNKQALRGKGITSISAVGIADDYGQSLYTMWATFSDAVN